MSNPGDADTHADRRRCASLPTTSPSAASQRERFTIGTEHEKFGFRP
jgi:gamma-glutamylcysteine synthetase